jgi:hypothetical protein
VALRGAFSNAKSAVDMRYHSRLGRGDGGEHRGHQGPKHRDVITWGVNDNYRQRKASKVLLIFEVAVDGKEKVKLLRCQLQQFTILHAGPARLGDGLDFVARKLLTEGAGTHSSSSTRIGDQVGLRLLERGNDNFSRDGGKVVKKLTERVTAFNVVDEGLHGDPRANKHRGAAEDVGVRPNDR